MYMMKPRNWKYMILAGVQSYISQPRGEEETRAGRWGTTIYGRDLKDWGDAQAESHGAIDQYK